jgi:hypothetical protein
MPANHLETAIWYISDQGLMGMILCTIYFPRWSKFLDKWIARKYSTSVERLMYLVNELGDFHGTDEQLEKSLPRIFKKYKDMPYLDKRKWHLAVVTKERREEMERYFAVSDEMDKKR